MRTALASSLLLALAVAAVLWLTMGLRVFTAEQARRLYVQTQQPLLPQTRLIDAAGQTHALRRWVQADGRVWIVDFIYTRCQTLCSALGTQYQRIQNDLRLRGLEDRVGLLTISFDPVHDDGPALAAYARRMGADPALWRIARVADPAALPGLLRFFGVVVIADESGQFQHNAAWMRVDASGRLTRIGDLSELWSDSLLARHLADASPPPVGENQDPDRGRMTDHPEVADARHP